ncbi:ABC transporter substrate-binding protein [Rhodovastum atsumiense]|uniref:ABC transporter substrate-binding protein n=1 Tax=Rhodovastum atsumiense TaxID=504468 RepID=A0A5M6INW2_9PROT|nr:ABC transporter substrate-binding protein [Rhodovastum atsumiense]KAA5609248.1 ABC transporter substrate-binding protein [Rhodovastum atsumiense]CAH2601700.1 ABC transporter substrate-binding protein [Rhodovastum atsumiense]
MRRRRLVPALAFAAAVLAWDAGAAHAAAPSFVRGGAVTLCTDPTYAPMEFFERPGERQPVGFDIDLARALAQRWGVSLRILTMDFTGLLPGLDAKRCDFVMSGTFVTPERLSRFNGVPYIASAQVILVRAGSSGVAAPDDLAGKVVSVQAGTVYEKRLHALDEAFRAAGRPGITIQAYPGGSDAVQQLTTGRAAATITQDTEAAYRAVAQKGQFAVAYSWPATDEFGIFFSKNPADYARIKADIEALRADGTIARLAATWHLPESDAAAPLHWPE